jgi:trehalose/maltose hydrolase-like predicted phosphorylase
MGWIIEEKGFDASKIAFWGSKFLTGNGYMGLRGTVEEFGSEQMASCTLAGLYDKNGDSWREPVNLAPPFYLRADWNLTPLDLLRTAPEFHRQSLNISDGVFGRETRFRTSDGTFTIMSRRFVSMDNIHLMAMRYTVTARAGGTLTVFSEPFGKIWDINGPHLQDKFIASFDDVLLFTAPTIELSRRVAAAAGLCLDGEPVVPDDGVWRIERRLDAGKKLEITVYAVIYKEGDDGCGDPALLALEDIRKSRSAGFDALRDLSAAAWRRFWEYADVVIEGDDEAQLALRYSLYLLMISTPFHTDKAAIPARGLSGQVYKGAMFWDTEIYMMPFYACCMPEVCRNLARYRVNTLGGALRKAAEYGYRGAFYAWESQETGDDGCTDFNLTDVHTGRPIRTYFRGGQIHISADVAYGIWIYYTATGDGAFLRDGGAEVILECARFLYDYSYWKPGKDRYELLDVTGADEYHERVNNDAYTNVMTKRALEAAFEALGVMKAHYPEEYELLSVKLNLREELPYLEDMLGKLYVPEPDPQTGLIEQFDGYFSREDVTPEELRRRELKPNEYWGSPVGLAVETQVIKQADVVLLMSLLGDKYTPEQKAANWNYYEPRTEHGSSLSICAYALLAAQCGMTDWAYRFFRRAAELDLRGDYKLFLGPLYIGGTHPAANGGSWMVAVRGFAGLIPGADGISLSPKLPKHWRSLSFTVCWHGQRFNVTTLHGDAEVRAMPENSKDVGFAVYGERRTVRPGDTVHFTFGGVDEIL